MSKPGMSDDDEKDLVDAEFESMVANLSLDQSSPSTYLDEIESRDSEIPEYAKVPRITFNLRSALKAWWKRHGRDGDGAIV